MNPCLSSVAEAELKQANSGQILSSKLEALALCDSNNLEYQNRNSPLSSNSWLLAPQLGRDGVKQ